MAGIEKSYPGVMWQAECGMYYYEMQQKLYEMLDAGCSTIVLAAPMAVYSHFEEFDSSFRHCSEYIEEWEKAHPGKKIKIIMAPPMGNFKPLRDAYLTMLKDRLDTLPKGASVAVAATVHGLPWDQRSWEAWIKLAPAYRDPLLQEIQELVSTYGFSKTTVMSCQDEFADPIRDPKDNYLATSEAYWKAINEGYDYVIGLPIEFFAENTDTLYYHAIKNYDGFDGYNVYEPVDYPDWSVPYTREFKQGKTRIIYNGVPVGKYQHFVVEALYAAVDSVLKKGAGK
jgi:protoheme ferro-lyase